MKRKHRDIEKERDELLKLMENSIAPEIQEKIDFAISCEMPSTIKPIETSNKGAFDAIKK